MGKGVCRIDVKVEPGRRQMNVVETEREGALSESVRIRHKSGTLMPQCEILGVEESKEGRK